MQLTHDKHSRLHGEESARVGAGVTGCSGDPPQTFQAGADDKEDHPYGAVAPRLKGMR